MIEVDLQPKIGTPQRRSLLDLTLAELTEWIQSLGYPAYRARQIWSWIYDQYAISFHEMTNLPIELRSALDRAATLSPLEPIQSTLSIAGDTQKVLFRLPDGETVETVLMVYEKRRTLCISSQVGCAMGCTFCATAQGGLARNLTSGEIIAQVLYFARYLSSPDAEPAMELDRPTAVTNVVLMGMGEPMHNYENVWAALRRLTDGDGFGLGARHVTLSTVGLVPMIERMAEENLQVTLAISLHAPVDSVRSALVPVNRRWNVGTLLQAVADYTEKTRRRVTFEYALMRDINDSSEMAEELGRRLAPLLCHVNLIPLNPIPDSPFQPTSDEDTERFARILRDHGVQTTVRLRRGIEIGAGCGQLRQAAQRRAA